MKLRLVGTCVLALALAACASASAYAGNGKGNGKEDPAAPPAVAPAQGGGNGNSANAPGQLKKDAAPAAAPAPAVAESAAAPIGVKPSNDTARDTLAAASSDQTKLYGSGKTAGQIALQNGAAPSIVLHGPGNSQPHKASPCAGGHEVDVHALKAKRRSSCGGSSPQPPPHSTPAPGPPPNSSHRPASAPGSPPAAAGGSSGPAVVAGGSVTAKPSGPAAGGADGNTLGATEAVARGILPFTGLDLWSAVFVGLTLMLLGLALCRRATTEAPAGKTEEEAGA